eukprot:scaffold26232_cov76-Cyclotella_meneghiniana.AAC.3
MVRLRQCYYTSLLTFSSLYTAGKGFVIPPVIQPRKIYVHQSTIFSSSNNDMSDGETSPIQTLFDTISTNPSKSVYFSFLMTICGASLGPFLDSYHSLFGVLTYDTPLVFPLIGTINDSDQALLTCVTTYWVPPLFGLAGFLIGWLYVLFDAMKIGQDTTYSVKSDPLDPSVAKVLSGISYFTFQYWLSGLLFAHGIDRTIILVLMSALATGGFIALDGTIPGLITSAATAIGGPLIEVGLISLLPEPLGYHYNDPGETGVFPLWIVPVYFLGGPANGNLARTFWQLLGRDQNKVTFNESSQTDICGECKGTRLVPCPNCDDGTYVTYNRRVFCKACRGKGVVICRNCFSEYGEDPNDLEGIRQLVDELIESSI